MSLCHRAQFWVYKSTGVNLLSQQFRSVCFGPEKAVGFVVGPFDRSCCGGIWSAGQCRRQQVLPRVCSDRKRVIGMLSTKKRTILTRWRTHVTMTTSARAQWCVGNQIHQFPQLLRLWLNPASSRSRRTATPRKLATRKNVSLISSRSPYTAKRAVSPYCGTRLAGW